MPTSQNFDFDQPTRDTLAGIYVEASDATLDAVAPISTPTKPDSVGQTLPRRDELFGLMLSVDDGLPAT